jgi:hypothetical protein
MSFFANRQGINLDFCTVSSGLLNEFRHFTVFIHIIPDITRNFLGNNEKSGGMPILPFRHSRSFFCHSRFSFPSFLASIFCHSRPLSSVIPGLTGNLLRLVLETGSVCDASS